MRCQYCGGFLHHHVTDYKGNRCYICHTLLTTKEINGIVQSGNINFQECNHAYKEDGVEFNGFVVLGGHDKPVKVPPLSEVF